MSGEISFSPFADAKPDAVPRTAPAPSCRCGDCSAQPSGKVTPRSAAGKGRIMPRADSATLNVQPRKRRDVYEGLATLAEGRSVKDLPDHFGTPESELRETLRQLERAGLVRRVKGLWWAILLDPPNEDPRARAVR
jgi:hypothetical protein